MAGAKMYLGEPECILGVTFSGSEFGKEASAERGRAGYLSKPAIYPQ